MLPRHLRLPLRQNLLFLKKQGKRINHSLFTILYSPQTNFLNPRFAILISRRVAAKATQRNKLKRQIYQEIQNLLPYFKKNYDILIITKPNIIKLEKEELRKEIKSIFGKISFEF